MSGPFPSRDFMKRFAIPGYRNTCPFRAQLSWNRHFENRKSLYAHEYRNCAHDPPGAFRKPQILTYENSRRSVFNYRFKFQAIFTCSDSFGILFLTSGKAMLHEQYISDLLIAPRNGKSFRSISPLISLSADLANSRFFEFIPKTLELLIANFRVKAARFLGLSRLSPCDRRPPRLLIFGLNFIDEIALAQ